MNVYWLEMTRYIRVAENEHEGHVGLPIEEDGTILLSTLASQFPGACGLRYHSESFGMLGIRLVDGCLHPPDNAWGAGLYLTVFPKESQRKMDEQLGKACKVWDSKREAKVALVAANFTELATIGKQLLNQLLKEEDKHIHDICMYEEVKIVLEEDGTIVSDDKYFQLLEPQTIFMFMVDSRCYRSNGFGGRQIGVCLHDYENQWTPRPDLIDWEGIRQALSSNDSQ